MFTKQFSGTSRRTIDGDSIVFVQQDEESLHRLLGMEQVPPAVANEYMIRLRMYHRDGHSGPIGTLGLIDMVRSLGLGPPDAVQPTETVDWRTVPHGTQVIVSGHLVGEYLGKLGSGTLAVRVEGMESVQEVTPPQLALVRSTLPADIDEESLERDGEGPDARAELLGEPVADSDVPAAGGEEPAVPVDPDFGWEGVKAGASVWVKEDGDLKDATFKEFAGGKLVVRVDGEDADRKIEPSTAIYAGE